MIKILLDQNIQTLIEPWLQKRLGNAAEITSTRMLGFQRMSDDKIFHFRQKKNMVIVTYDDDFQNPLIIEETPGCGVVRLNVYPTGFKQTQSALQRLLETYPVETWQNAFIVVDKHKIRRRQ